MRLHLSSPAADFELVAPNGADLDQWFDAFALDTHEWMTINGPACDLKRCPGPSDGDELPASLRAWNRLDDAGRAQILASVGERDTPQALYRACLAAMGSGDPLAFVGAA